MTFFGLNRFARAVPGQWAILCLLLFSGCQIRVFRSQIHRLSSPQGPVATAGSAVAEIAVSGSSSVVAGNCTGALTVQRLDEAGDPLVLPVSTTVSPSDFGSGQFYSDSLCLNPIAAIAIPAGAGDVDVYFADTVAEAMTFSFAAAGALPGSHPLTVVADVPHALVFSGATTAAANACVALTIAREDQYGNSATPASATVVTLGGVGSGSFYTTNTCATTTTTRTIASGGADVVAYYRNRFVEPAVTLSASGLVVDGAQSFTATGPFALPVLVPAATSGLPVALHESMVGGDFDNDGNRDVAVSAGFAADSVYVLRGNGSGSFVAGATLATAANPMGIAAVSLRNDGNTDLLVTNLGQAAGTNNLSVFLANGNGTFQAPAHYPSAGGKIVARGVAASTNLLNTAGRVDVVVSYEGDSGASYVSSGIDVFPGNGDGTLGAPDAYAMDGARAAPPVVGDLNGDGNSDFVVPLAEGGDANASWFRNDGGGSGFTPLSINPGAGFRADNWAFGHFNGDAFLDFTIGISYSGLFASNGNGANGFALQLVDVAINDVQIRRSLTGVFTASGHTDLLHLGSQTAPFPRNGVILYLGNGNGTFGDALFYTLSAQTRDVVRADYDGDGKADLVVLADGGRLFFLKGL